MESIKCQQCGLVTWADSEDLSCKRCAAPLWQKNDYGAGFEFNETGRDSMFSGIIKFLTIGLGVALGVLLICKAIGAGDATKVVAGLFIVIGIVLVLAMKFWFLAAVFGESVGWGFASLFLPFGALIALIKFWDKTRRPFVAHLLSSGIILVGILVGI